MKRYSRVGPRTTLAVKRKMAELVRLYARQSNITVMEATHNILAVGLKQMFGCQPSHVPSPSSW